MLQYRNISLNNRCNLISIKVSTSASSTEFSATTTNDAGSGEYKYYCLIEGPIFYLNGFVPELGNMIEGRIYEPTEAETIAKYRGKDTSARLTIYGVYIGRMKLKDFKLRLRLMGFSGC